MKNRCVKNGMSSVSLSPKMYGAAANTGPVVVMKCVCVPTDAAAQLWFCLVCPMAKEIKTLNAWNLSNINSNLSLHSLQIIRKKINAFYNIDIVARQQWHGKGSWLWQINYGWGGGLVKSLGWAAAVGKADQHLCLCVSVAFPLCVNEVTVSADCSLLKFIPLCPREESNYIIRDSSECIPCM